jgi:hypothetical protein
MGSRRIALSRLTPAHHRAIIATQLLFFLGGLLLLGVGAVRIALEFTDELINLNSEQLKDGLASRVPGAGEVFTSPIVLIVAIATTIVGYSLIWGVAAIGAKEPPAWSTARYGLMVLIAVLASLAALLVVVEAPLLLPTVAVVVVLLLASLWLLVRFIQTDFKLALGAEKLRQQDKRSGVSWVASALVVMGTSTMIVLTLVYAVLTDIIELPVSDAEPGELIYISTYDNFNDEWDIEDDGSVSAQVVENDAGNNWLVLSMQETDGVFSLLDRTLRNFDLRVMTTQLESDEAHDNIYGIIFGYRGDDEPYFQFQVSGDGYYRLMKIIPAGDTVAESGIAGQDITISTWKATTTLSEDATILTSNPTLIRPGRGNDIEQPLDRENELRVVVRDERFAFFINGERVPLCLKGTRRNSMWVGEDCVEGNIQTFSYRDDEYRQGQVGFFVNRTSSSDLNYNITVAFDSVVIVGPPDTLSSSILEGVEPLP